MVDATRSVKVELSLSAQRFIAESRNAAGALGGIAQAAKDVRPHLVALTTEAGMLHRAMTSLAGGTAVSSLVADFVRLSAAMRGIGSGSGLADLARLSTALRGLSGGSLGTLRTDLARLTPELRTFGTLAGSSAADINRLGAALRGLGLGGGGLGGNLAGIQAQLRSLQDQIDKLRRAAGGGSGGGSGGSGGGLLGGLFGSFTAANLASNAISSATSSIVSGFKQSVMAAADFETTINTFGAVTGTTGDALSKVSQKAIQLGADITIANASASDAANVMTELAKGGLNVADAMEAAKGTLQLAAAGGVAAAQAAEIETSALASFQLGATEAAHVADVLANTANAARGNISDFAEGLKYVGAVAHTAGWSIDQTSAILAVFAQNGITGSMGGTTLKEMLLRLEAPSKAAAKAIQELNIQVYDSNGHFINDIELTKELAAAKGRMSEADFNAAAATVFGARAIQGATILASSGATAVQNMTDKVNSGAGAAAYSTAKMQGLGGAFANLQNQVETAQVELGERFSPALQKVINFAAGAIPTLTDFASHLSFSGVADFFKPVIDGAIAVGRTAWPYIQRFGADVGSVFNAIIGFIRPVVAGFGDFFKGISQSGVVAMFGSALDGVGSALKTVFGWLQPLGKVVGDVIGWIGKLPTPIWAGTAALAGFLLLRGPLNAMFLQLTFGYARVGSAIMSAFSGGVLSAVKAGGSALLGAFGGPLGLAITAATTFLTFLPSIIKGNKDAANAAQDHADAVQSLADAYRDSNGQIDENVRKTALSQIQNAKWGDSSTDLRTYADNLKTVGITTGDLVDATLNLPGAVGKVEGAYERQRATLVATVQAHTTIGRRGAESQDDVGRAAQATLTILDQQHAAFSGLSGSMEDAKARALEDTQATYGWAAAMTLLAAQSGLVGNNLGQMSEHGAGHAALTDLTTASATAVAQLDLLAGQTDTNTTKLTSLAQAMQASSAAASDATTEVDFFYQSLMRLQGGTVSAEEQQRAQAGAIRNIAKQQIAAAQNKADVQAKQDAYNAIVAEGGPVTSAAVEKYNAKVKAAQDKLDQLTAQGAPTASAAAVARYQAQLQTAQANLAALTQQGKPKKGQTQAQYDAAVASAGAQVDALTSQGGPAGQAASVASYNQQLKAAQAALSALQSQGAPKSETQAQYDARKAQALRDLKSAQQSTLDISDQLFDANVKAADGARQMVASTIAGTLATKGLDAAEHAAHDTMAALRKQFIDGAVAAGQTKDAATQLADRLGLTAQGAVKAFNDAVATATAEGETLYRTYDKVKGTWTAKFETKDEAKVEATAGKILEAYNATAKTWSATLDVNGEPAKTKAEALGATLSRVTEDRLTRLSAEDGVTAHLKDIQGLFDSFKNKTVKFNVQGLQATIDANNAHAAAKGNARGGFQVGPGTGTSDSIPAWLSNGEYVINARDTARNRPLLDHINKGGTGIPAFKDGGPVGMGGLKFDMSTSGLDAIAAAFKSTMEKGAALAIQAAQNAVMAAPNPALFSSQDPSSWGWKSGSAASIVPYSYGGVPFVGGVAAGTSPMWNMLLSRIVPIIPGGINPGEDWGYEDRANVNNPSMKSFHAYGLALDVNSSENPNMPGTTGQAGTGKFQIPNAAGPIARSLGFLWGGEWGDAMHFELHAYPSGAGVGSLGSAFASGQNGQVIGTDGQPLPPQVMRWRPLIDRAMAAKGFPTSKDYIVLNQMMHESSGDPSAINLYDSNALAGHPSQGVLQFIPSTFARYSDQGFKNFLGVEDQVRAFLNYVPARYGSLDYLTSIGYGAYKDGGIVRGLGSGTSDSNLIRVSNGEGINTARAMSYPSNRAAMDYMNAGGVMSAPNVTVQVVVGSGDPLAQAVGAMIETGIARDNRQLLGALIAAGSRSRN